MSKDWIISIVKIIMWQNSLIIFIWAKKKWKEMEVKKIDYRCTEKVLLVEVSVFWLVENLTV